jgi:hypothetical protein
MIMSNERVYRMAFLSIYPLLIKKSEGKGCTKQEVDATICWLTGYGESGLAAQIEKAVDYQTFFAVAPR